MATALPHSCCQSVWLVPNHSQPLLRCRSAWLGWPLALSTCGTHLCTAAPQANFGNISLLTALPFDFHTSSFLPQPQKPQWAPVFWETGCLFIWLGVCYVCLSAKWEMAFTLTDTLCKALKAQMLNVRGEKGHFPVLDSGCWLFTAEVSREWDFPGRSTNVKCISVKVGAPNPPRAKGLIQNDRI